MSNFRLSSLKEKTEVFRNIVIALAVLIGGIWSTYTFNQTLQIENAVAELKALNRQLDENAVINTALTAQVIESKKGEYTILMSVFLSNNGKKVATVTTSPDLFTIALTQFESGKTKEFVSKKYSNLYYIPTQEAEENLGIITAISLNPGQERELQAVFRVSNPGIYKVDFKVTPDNEVSDRITNNLEGDALDYDVVRIYASRYFVVQ